MYLAMQGHKSYAKHTNHEFITFNLILIAYLYIGHKVTVIPNIMTIIYNKIIC
jgi:hypothetical protein